MYKKHARHNQYASIDIKLKSFTVEGSCHLYQGCTNDSGYCPVMIEGKFYYVHRLAYTHYLGAIPEGMTVDHVCFNRRCINPKHLRLLTHAANAGRQRISQLTNYCVKGHKKIRYANGKGDCPTCRKSYKK